MIRYKRFTHCEGRSLLELPGAEYIAEFKPLCCLPSPIMGKMRCFPKVTLYEIQSDWHDPKFPTTLCELDEGTRNQFKGSSYCQNWWLHEVCQIREYSVDGRGTVRATVISRVWPSDAEEILRCTVVHNSPRRRPWLLKRARKRWAHLP